VLVVAQVALSVVLLAGAVLLVRSVQQLYGGPGFDPAQVIILRLRPSLVDRSTESAWTFQKTVVSRLEAAEAGHGMGQGLAHARSCSR